MKRRLAVKNLVLASASLITLPSWMKVYGSTDDTHLSTFTVTEQQIIASATDTIIPAGNSIGALSVGVDKYFQKMIDDCYDTTEKDIVRNGLQQLQQSTVASYGKPFTACDQQQRQGQLQKWATSENKEQKDFFNLLKKETITGFNTSQQVLQGHLGYQVAPGHYYGCVNVKA